MTDYISRVDAVGVLRNAQFEYTCDEAADFLLHIPAANVVPVVRGKWIEQEEWSGVEAFGFKEMTVGSFKCSVCGFEIDVSEGEFHYCPNCGALMDKDGDGE